MILKKKSFFSNILLENEEFKIFSMQKFKKKKKKKKRKEKQTFIVQNVREWSTKPFTNGNFSKHLLN